jgi:pyruvate/2-oxoglutarate dehydrogenase complex dihydrolipoamide acyltransferase (E2) component
MSLTPIPMPRISEQLAEATVDRWLKQPGDAVAVGEPIAEVIGDKVSVEITSPVDGTLVKLSVAEGTTVAVGREIAVVETR